jgi:hypothetical protein
MADLVTVEGLRVRTIVPEPSPACLHVVHHERSSARSGPNMTPASPRCHIGATLWAVAESTAYLDELLSGGLMDCAVDHADTEQGGFRCVAFSVMSPTPLRASSLLFVAVRTERAFPVGQ